MDEEDLNIDVEKELRECKDNLKKIILEFKSVMEDLNSDVYLSNSKSEIIKEQQRIIDEVNDLIEEMEKI